MQYNTTVNARDVCFLKVICAEILATQNPLQTIGHSVGNFANVLNMIQPWQDSCMIYEFGSAKQNNFVDF